MSALFDSPDPRPMPEAPSREHSEVDEARRKMRKRLAQAKGHRGTILGGSDEGSQVSKATLLGE